MRRRKKYGTVVADPPWPYKNVGDPKAFQRKMVKDGSRRMTSITEWTYQPMPMSEIMGLPVRAITLPDSHLYLWTTNAFLREAFDVMERWGYTYKTTITWGKVRKSDPTKPSMKMGHYYRGATEHCLFGVRGRTPKPTTAYPTLFLHERIGKHSAKPADFMRVVEDVSPGPYLEMFCREAQPGWDVWGDQVEGSIVLPTKRKKSRVRG